MSENIPNGVASPSPAKKKPFYKKWWVWLFALTVVGAISAPKDEQGASSSGQSYSSSKSSRATKSARQVVKEYADMRGISIGQLRQVNDRYYGFRNSGGYETYEIMGFITGTSTSITQLVELEKDSSGEWTVNRTKTY